MTKKEFKKAIKNIHDFYLVELGKLNQIVAVLTDKEFNYSSIGYKYMEQSINWLSELVGDNGADSWINWYIYENNWGLSKYEAGYDDKTKPITNADELWDLIQEGKNRQK